MFSICMNFVVGYFRVPMTSLSQDQKEKGVSAAWAKRVFQVQGSQRSQSLPTWFEFRHWL